MTVNEILTQLESLGDDARRKHNVKAGAPENQFGVKLGDIRPIAKKIKTDHELALKLWETGNVEAQLLATLIIKPKSLSANELDALTRSTTCAGGRLAERVCRRTTSRQGSAAREVDDGEGPLGRPRGLELHRQPREQGKCCRPRPAGATRSHRERDAEGAARGPVDHEQHTGAIGIHHPQHRKRAIAIGEKIGLYRDWPVSKGCTPPYVPVWVDEMVKRQG